MLYFKELIEHLKTNNRYPERFSKVLSEDEWEKLHKICKENNINSEAAFWEWGRMVWNNCITDSEEFLKAQGIEGNWIDVNYRLPEEGQKVLALNVDSILQLRFKNGKFLKNNWEYPCIAHWTPFPELPLKSKESQNA